MESRLKRPALFPGYGKAIVAPQAARLVAFAVAGAAVAVEIALPVLNGSDQVGFRLPIGDDVKVACDITNVLELHGHSPLVYGAVE